MLGPGEGLQGGVEGPARPLAAAVLAQVDGGLRRPAVGRPAHEDVYKRQGMSGDFTDAILEGATLVRVGTALFGPRPPVRALG